MAIPSELQIYEAAPGGNHRYHFGIQVDAPTPFTQVVRRLNVDVLGGTESFDVDLGLTVMGPMMASGTTDTDSENSSSVMYNLTAMGYGVRLFGDIVAKRSAPPKLSSLVGNVTVVYTEGSFVKTLKGSLILMPDGSVWTRLT